MDEKEINEKVVEIGLLGSTISVSWLIAAIIALLCVAVALVFTSRHKGEMPNGGTGGAYKCSSWSNAPAGFQDKITIAANKAKIHPALLAAIYLSEHSDDWYTPQGGTWTSSDPVDKADGPFQIIPTSWPDFWQAVTNAHLNDGKSASQVSRLDFETAALAAAVDLSNALKKVNKPTDSSDQQSIVFAGLWYNAGQKHALEWSSAGFNLNTPPAIGWGNPGTHDYAKRTWSDFQNLDKGCSSVLPVGGNSPQVPKEGHVFPLAKTTGFSDSFLGDRCGGTGSGNPHAHGGIDIMHTKDEHVPVYAVVDGTIFRINTGSIRLQSTNPNDHYTYFYQHLFQVLVTKGQIVKAGDLIAYSGGHNAGSIGDHTHFGMMLNPGAAAEVPISSCSVGKNDRASIATQLGIVNPYKSLKNWQN